MKCVSRPNYKKTLNKIAYFYLATNILPIMGKYLVGPISKLWSYSIEPCGNCVMCHAKSFKKMCFIFSPKLDQLILPHFMGKTIFDSGISVLQTSITPPPQPITYRKF